MLTLTPGTMPMFVNMAVPVPCSVWGIILFLHMSDQLGVIQKFCLHFVSFMEEIFGFGIMTRSEVFGKDRR